jgi:hypothetical protein
VIERTGRVVVVAGGNDVVVVLVVVVVPGGNDVVVVLVVVVVAGGNDVVVVLVVVVVVVVVVVGVATVHWPWAKNSWDPSTVSTIVALMHGREEKYASDFAVLVPSLKYRVGKDR